ncbi:MAG: hypothetical protein ACRC20_12325 [Segniliparus sp.]|uniref:hypothetical protein n=1 Tax=Segniliparus sp. TaxID=2804064 RepID=UPI003F34617E
MTKNETVEELTPGMTGRWLVTTQGSQHLWDLDRMLYTRLPGEQSLAGKFGLDGEAHPITRIGRHPRVGETSLVFFDDPSDPTKYHWRQSSVIKKIERLPDTTEDQGEVRAVNGYVIIHGADPITPGEACYTAFCLADQGEHALAERIRKAADQADRQEEETTSRDEEDNQGSWAYLSGAVKSTLEEGLGQDGEGSD